jgi:hypothetical protein
VFSQTVTPLSNIKINSKLLYIILLLISQYANSQEVKGIIKDNGNPVFAASVYLKNNSGISTSADLDGFFTLNINNIPINDTLVISFLGYESVEIPLKQIDYNKNLVINLKMQDNILSEVQVTLNTTLSREFAIQKVSKLDIYTNPGSSGDALKMVASLPVATNDNENANPELRGSSANMSRVLLNNVPIYEPVKNTQIDGMGGFSLFNTELIDNMEIYASNPPLIYGNATAGIVRIDTKQTLEKTQSQISLSLANIGLLHSHKIRKKAFLQLYSNMQYSDAFLKINRMEDLKSFKSNDIGFNLNINISKSLTFNLYSYAISEKYLATDNIFNYTGEVDGQKKRWLNVLNFQLKKRNYNISFNHGSSFSVFDYNFGNMATLQYMSQFYNNIDSKYYLGSDLTIQTGIMFDYSNFKFNNQFPEYNFDIKPDSPNYKFSQEQDGYNLEFYIYAKRKIINDLIGGMGLRKNISINRQKEYLSHQLNLNYSPLKDHTLIFSTGNYHGYSIPNFYLQDFYPISSRQLALDYIWNNYIMNITTGLYYKRENIYQYSNIDGDIISVPKKIKGLEIGLNKKINNIELSFSYTFLSSKEKINAQWCNSENKMDFLIKSRICYSNKSLGTINITYCGRSGHYYTPIEFGEWMNKIGTYKPIWGGYNLSQYKNYHKIDLTYNRYFTYNKFLIVAFLTCNNILNVSNQKKAYYNEDYSDINKFSSYQERSIYGGIQVSW